jgi:hypothetical protein
MFLVRFRVMGLKRYVQQATISGIMVSVLATNTVDRGFERASVE